MSLKPIDPDEAIRYEVALELLNAAIGFYSASIAAEEVKVRPDRALLDELHSQQAAHAHRRLSLHVGDSAVEDAIAEVGPFVRRCYGDRPMTTKQIDDLRLELRRVKAELKLERELHAGAEKAMDVAIQAMKETSHEIQEILDAGRALRVHHLGCRTSECICGLTRFEEALAKIPPRKVDSWHGGHIQEWEAAESDDESVVTPEMMAMQLRTDTWTGADETDETDGDVLEPVWLSASERRAVAWAVSQAWATGEDGWLDLAARIAPVDREPQPSDGPDFKADHKAWEQRQAAESGVTGVERCTTCGLSPDLCADHCSGRRRS